MPVKAGLIVTDSALAKPSHRGLWFAAPLVLLATPEVANHVGYALRSFVRLEHHRFTTGVSWFEAKWGIVRDAVRAYLANPVYTLPKAATA